MSNQAEPPGRKAVRIEREIKQYYTELRRRLGQPGYSPSPRSDGDWARTADLVIKLNVDPMVWLEAQFERCKYGNFPMPNHLYSETAQQNYDAHIAEFRGLPQEEVRTQTTYVENYTTRAGWDPEELFMREELSHQFYAYFRVLFCPETILPQVIERWGEDAKRQIESNSALYKYLEENHGARLERIIVRQEIPGNDGGTPPTVPPPSPPCSVRESIAR